MVETRYGSIEPSKKLYSKIGTGASYSLDEVVAELIDNAIDARTEGQLRLIQPETLVVDVFVNKDVIEVKDNAKGMNGKSAVGALKLAESTDESRKLSGFGLGLKTGSLSIGDTFSIITGIEGSEEKNKVHFNIQKWENSPELGFNKPYPYEVVHKPREEHGTKIVITDLRTNINKKKIDDMLMEIGNRYKAYMKNNEVIIKVNGSISQPEKIEWKKGYPISIDIATKHGKITGLMGITEHMTYMRGGWGFDLFRNNRLISQREKLNKMLEHPSYALLRGELNLNFVPVNQTKNRFIYESKEWDDALKALKEDQSFKDMLKLAHDLKWNPYGAEGGISRKSAKKIDAKMEVLARVLDRKYREEFKPNATIPLDDANKGNIIEVEIEQRESPSNRSGASEEGDGSRKRTPKRYHKVLKFKHSSGKIFIVEHDTNYVEGGPRKAMIEEKHRVVVYTNLAYPAFKNTGDEPFYVMENVIDSLVERRAKDNNYNMDKFVVEKDKLMADLYSERERRIESG